MELISMDDILIKINKIENIDSIKFYYIRNVIPALIVTCSNGIMLNLCSKDKYFIQLAKKVREVYSIEKDRENKETELIKKPNIDIDETTKAIIEKGSLEKTNELYKFYIDKTFYDESLLFQIDEFKSLLPIIKYHIIEFFSKTDITISIDDDFTGYRNNYILTGKINGTIKTFKVSFSNQIDNEYEFNVCGIFSKCSSLNIKVKFKKDKLEVQMNIPDYNLYGYFTYVQCEDDVKSLVEIVKNNLPIYYNFANLEKSEEIKLFDENNNYKWFKLPWDAYYGIHSEKEKIGDEGTIVDQHNSYLQKDENSFFKKEYYSKYFINNANGGLVPDSVIMDEEIKNVTCISLEDDIYVIETRFLSSKGIEGYYEEKLSNKFFYHIVRSKDGIKNIIRDNSICITKDEINCKGDLLNKARVLSIFGGNK